MVVIHPNTHFAQIIARDIFDGKVQYLAVPSVIISPPMSRVDASAALQLLEENGISAHSFLHEIFARPLHIDAAAMFGTQYKARDAGLRYTLVGIWGDRALMAQDETQSLFAPRLSVVADTMQPCSFTVADVCSFREQYPQL